MAARATTQKTYSNQPLVCPWWPLLPNAEVKRVFVRSEVTSRAPPWARAISLVL